MSCERVMMRFVAVVVLLSCVVCIAAPARQGFENFIRRDGDVLKDGDREFRFISFNIPNLHYVEDDMRFEQGMPFRLPDAFEIDDALGTIAQMGGQVARMYALSVKKPGDPPEMPRHILGPGQFNEQAFVALDQVLAAAHRHRVRVIIPFIDQWSWFGGTTELAGFRGKKPEEFWTDSQVIEDYKGLVAFVINRMNTVTGVRYRDDKAILAWETGNELHCPAEWTRQVTAHIKSLDSQHLVIDGTHREVLLQSSLDDPSVDFVQTHHYEKDARQMIAHIVESARMAKGKKPYHLGEFGFLSTAALSAIMDAVRDHGLAGALLWSLRYRTREGGFYWHHEPAGGDYFKAYHWPGFEIGEQYDERGLMRLAREKAFEIQGTKPPPLREPAPPHLLTVTNGGQMTWQGTVGAACYDVQRAEKARGPWITVGTGVSEAQVQYRPLFVDESARPGRAYYYRVIARNPSGSSKPSNVVGPVRVTHRTLVDEFWNDSRMLAKEGKLQFVNNQARKFKEDCHRLSGESKSAVVYHAPGGVQAVRVFLFSPSDQPGIRVAVSKDGRTFEPVELTTARTITYGEDAYGFWKALRSTGILPVSSMGVPPMNRNIHGQDARATHGRDAHATETPNGVTTNSFDYVKVEFQSESQLSRIEIDHDVAE